MSFVYFLGYSSQGLQRSNTNAFYMDDFTDFWWLMAYEKQDIKAFALIGYTKTYVSFEDTLYTLFNKTELLSWLFKSLQLKLFLQKGTAKIMTLLYSMVTRAMDIHVEGQRTFEYFFRTDFWQIGFLV